MTAYDSKLHLVMAILTLAAIANADKPKQLNLPSVSREAEEDYNRGEKAANGDGVPQDYVTAARYYRRAAERGNIRAQYALACLYEEGSGVPKDFGQAAAWYRKAADQGDAEAQNNLGVLYSTGQGVPQDAAEAVRLYRLAAAQGDLEGSTNLGAMYLMGRGVERNLTQAFQLFRKAAESGYSVAQNNLALMYANGQAVHRDYVLAYAWLELAAVENEGAAGLRDRIGKEMTPAQIARARGIASQKRKDLAQKAKTIK